ncbi:glycosyl transferase family 1 [Azospirillum baldaniorum]|uniref:Glycosyl transferase, group 1 n=1 Tax=Azospirillum baldaniorum TaxID=1064539 RepID=A0A9P1JNF7_9PROT|nr:glycosyltransferase family 4 protein [Azospirillum baldaniorum]AWJ88432.1 glycosyl transferase family 1 [Azospirillum baldaniorum]TWA80053.1 glycosyltransferase involved in cell wall biosynthesis [Azospirillum brasilense]CCC96652.1 glycosyl transferase, group 1 [Azospirillum baldaniorum]
MRIAFYAPLKSPTHPVPSGDRRMARLLMAALEGAGHRVTLACTLRSWDDGRRPGRAERLAALGARCADRLTARWRDDPPDLWFTYHLYHKAPDWIGPAVCRRFGIPYVVAEASFAAKRAAGPFAAGHRAAEAAIRQAAAVVNLAGHDAEGVLPLLQSPDRLVRLRPFLDTCPFAAAAAERDRHRAALAERYGLNPDVPWLLTVGMMRGGDKERSYEILAEALSPSPAQRGRGGVGASALPPHHLLIVGDGPARARIEALFEGGTLAPTPTLPRSRRTEGPPAASAQTFGLRESWAGEGVLILGQQDSDALTALYAAADLMVWPAVNEAYGMALLEAQAAGLPVVAGRTGGVPDVVRDGVTGLLPPVGDAEAFAAAIRALLDDPGRRRRFGEAARRIAEAEHDLRNAVAVLDGVVRRAARKGSP